MHLFLDVIGIEFKLLFWIILGSICGLAVELNTGDKKSSILYHSKLLTGSLFIRFAIVLINVLVGTIFAYVGTPFIAAYLKIDAANLHYLGCLVGAASLSLVKGYAYTWRNKRNLMDIIFKVIDFLRSAK